MGIPIGEHTPVKPNPKRAEWLLTGPSFIWLIVLFVLPTLLVFAIAFKPFNPDGQLGPGWTLDSIRGLANPNYPAIVWRTLSLSAITTLICLIVGTPTAYFMARATRWRQTLLMLVIVPFWTSFLIRIFAWKVLLHPEGAIKNFLVFVGLADASTVLLYRPEAVLLVLVYTSLPFAILPLYAASEKFDFSLLEAARDLGATPWKAFLHIFVPGISRGLWTAMLMVLIPALGAYVIPDVVGGKEAEMIGNKIAQRTFNDRNLPHASGLSAILSLVILLPLVLGQTWQWWNKRKAGKS
ncbi:MAG: ABC transporter permease [Acidobacteria bacterium]|nr:ABC transporter permease [Acidobacteriota bacterium]MCB9397348.1 ABC transporter permease [Acidobacteriota bacterium]